MKQKLLLADATTLAGELVDQLSPACNRILIAGSIRRQKPEIGDIEIVLIPAYEPVLDLFGEPSGLFSNALDRTLSDLKLPIIKGGEKYKQVLWRGVQADLFICTPDTWGCIATIRTGSADFTHWLVTPKRKGGGCPGHLQFKEGRLRNGSTLLNTREETDLFYYLGLDWVAPEDRIEGRWRKGGR